MIVESLRILRDRVVIIIARSLSFFRFVLGLENALNHHATKLFYLSQILALVLFLSDWTWLAITTSAFGFFTGAIGYASSAYRTVLTSTVSPAPARPITSEFAHVIARAFDTMNTRPTSGHDEGDLLQIAHFEEAAFPGYDRSLHQRVDRMKDWVSVTDGVGQIILLNGEAVGYSIIFPISERQASRYLGGTLSEWGLSVAELDPDARFHSYYAQSIFIKHRYQGSANTLGFAQAAALKHMLYLVSKNTVLHGADPTYEVLRKTLEKTRVLADEFSLPGRRFMRTVGFEPVSDSSDDGRTIWELNFSSLLRNPKTLESFEFLIRRALQEVPVEVGETHPKSS